MTVVCFQRLMIEVTVRASWLSWVHYATSVSGWMFLSLVQALALLLLTLLALSLLSPDDLVGWDFLVLVDQKTRPMTCSF